jgi:hypothetical protein
MRLLRAGTFYVAAVVCAITALLAIGYLVKPLFEDNSPFWLFALVAVGSYLLARRLEKA